MAGQMGQIYEDDNRYSDLLDKIDDVDSLNKRTTQSSDDFTQSLLGELKPELHYGTANRGRAYSIIPPPEGSRDYSYSLTVDQLEDFDPMGDVPNPSCAGNACAKIKRGLKKIAKTLKRKKSSKKGGKRKSRRKKRRRRTRRRKKRRKKSRKRKRFRK